MTWIEIALLLVAIVMTVVIALRRQPMAVGAELAAAQAREDKRRARGDAGLSPLAGVDYGGDALLIAPKPSPADERIRELAKQYASSDAKTREAMRYSLDLDDQYKLTTFARRAAVFGMRERWWIESALQAVAMLDIERMDHRDVPGTLAYVHHAAKRAGVDSRQAFAEAEKLASSNNAWVISRFIADYPPDADLREDWCFEEYEGGFLSRGLAEYEPVHDLARLAVEIADVIGRDRYDVSDVTVAEELPPVWFAPNEEEALEILEKARGGANVHADLREDEQQMLMVFLVELEHSRDAERLVDLARNTSGRDYALLPVAAGTLFCLFVQRGEVVGADAAETDQTLARFAAPVKKILAA